MNNALKTGVWVIVIAVLIFLSGSFFTVGEGQRAVLLQLGEMVTANGKPIIFNPGLHFKWPLINQVRKFDVRLQTLRVQSSRILTQDQKYVLVDYYIKWRVEDLPLYYQRIGNDPSRAETLLQQQANDELSTAFGQRTLTEMVSGERVNILAILKNSANDIAKNLGIFVADVRIKSIDLPKELSESVFSRMRTKREQVATQYRSEGRAMAEGIKATADGQATIKVADAMAKAADLRAQGTAQAAQIYAAAYSQDPEFFAFYRSLEAYKNAFSSKSDLILLTPDSEFLKYFNQLPSTSTGRH